jgi:hypothetical protein
MAGGTEKQNVLGAIEELSPDATFEDAIERLVLRMTMFLFDLAVVRQTKQL